MKTYIIGDIHGCFEELIELCEKINLKPEDLIIALGDIVDRGNKSKEVYAYLKKRPNTIVLVGNHERKHENGILSYAQEIVKFQFGNEYDEFKTWISTLPYFYETNEAIIVHASVEHDKNLHEQKQEVLSGSTSGERQLEKKYGEKYWTEFYRGEKAVIYGHHVVGDLPKILNNTYGIDTGACHNGFLTAIELPNFKVHQVKSKMDYWKEQQSSMQVPILESKTWENMEIENISKQIEKLSYHEQPEIKNFLTNLQNWVDELGVTLIAVKDKLDNLHLQLLKSPKTYSLEANKTPFANLLFKAKTNRLTIEELKKNIDTPNKLKELSAQLDIVFPERTPAGK